MQVENNSPFYGKTFILRSEKKHIHNKRKIFKNIVLCYNFGIKMTTNITAKKI